MGRYVDGHTPTRSNPSGDTLLIVAALGIGGLVLYSKTKSINTSQIAQQVIGGAIQAVGDTLGGLDSCQPPFDRASWSQALMERLTADRRFWCSVESWVRLQIQSGNLQAASNWDSFRHWYLGLARPWSAKPDPGTYGPAEFYAYAMTQAGAGGGGGGGGGGSW